MSYHVHYIYKRPYIKQVHIIFQQHPKTINFAFADSQLSTQHSTGVKTWDRDNVFERKRRVYPRTVVSVRQHYKNTTKYVGLVQSGHIVISLNATCSRHDIAEKLHNHSLFHCTFSDTFVHMDHLTVIISMLILSVEETVGFILILVKTTNQYLLLFFFSTMHAVLSSKMKDWLAQSPDNVSMQRVIST